MVRYSDSEVRIFHPLCESAAQSALSRINSSYEVLHHQYTGTLEMDFVVRNRATGRFLCVIEVKRTPNAVQSTRYQFQAQSYVQMNQNNNEKNYFIITNLETLISFKYDPLRSKIYQQILNPGFEKICNFTEDDEDSIREKLTEAFERIFRSFLNDQVDYLAESTPFFDYLSEYEAQNDVRKSNLAILMYEYIRGSFRSINRRDLPYDVRTFNNNVPLICQTGNAVDFDGIFSYNADEFSTNSFVAENVLSGAYDCGRLYESGDAVADVIFDRETHSEESRHNGEVPTDPELAVLAATLAKMVCENFTADSIVCDPAAGSGNLLCAATKVFPNISPRNLRANDVKPKFRELLSLRLGLRFPSEVCRNNASLVSICDLVNLDEVFFNDVSVILLNPPFVSGVTDSNRKEPFYRKIRQLTGRNPVTNVGQMNLSAVFLETVCCMAREGTTIACICPKAQLTAGGPEGVAFRQMLLDIFGLRMIFNYPSKGLFESVSENTCVLVGKNRECGNRVTAFCSNTILSNLDMNLLQNVDLNDVPYGEYDVCLPAVEAKNFTNQEMRDRIHSGWKMLSRVKHDAVNFVNNNLSQNAKLQIFAEFPNSCKRGQIGTEGLSDLIYFDSKENLYQLYSQRLQFENGLRNARLDTFELNAGDSLVLNVRTNDNAVVDEAIQSYSEMEVNQGKQSRHQKTFDEIKNIMARYAGKTFPANSIIIPREIRRDGRVYVSSVPLYVSTNFIVLEFESYEEALILGSYAMTPFFQLECEIESKDHNGMRKQETYNIKRVRLPRINQLSNDQKIRIRNCLNEISFLNLNNPQIRELDNIWAKILFGDAWGEKLNETTLLLSLIANERNS